MGKLQAAALVLLASVGVVEVCVPALMPPPAMTAVPLDAVVGDIPPDYQALIAKWAGAY